LLDQQCVEWSLPDEKRFVPRGIAANCSTKAPTVRGRIQSRVLTRGSDHLPCCRRRDDYRRRRAWRGCKFTAAGLPIILFVEQQTTGGLCERLPTSSPPTCTASANLDRAMDSLRTRRWVPRARCCSSRETAGLRGSVFETKNRDLKCEWGSCRRPLPMALRKRHAFVHLYSTWAWAATLGPGLNDANHHRAGASWRLPSAQIPCYPIARISAALELNTCRKK